MYFIFAQYYGPYELGRILLKCSSTPKSMMMELWALSIATQLPIDGIAAFQRIRLQIARADTEIECEIDGNRKLLDDKCYHHFRLWPCIRIFMYFI